MKTDSLSAGLDYKFADVVLGWVENLKIVCMGREAFAWLSVCNVL